MASPSGKHSKKTTSKISGSLSLCAVEEVGGIYCRKCCAKYENKKKYDDHYGAKHLISNNTTSIVYTCVICYKDVNNYASFRSHCYKVHLYRNKFSCDECDINFSRESVLLVHIKKFHKNVCKSCDIEFSSKNELLLHSIKHKSDTDALVCKFCENTLESTNDFEQHTDLHVEYKYKCPICDQNIMEKNDALDHAHIHFEEVHADIDSNMEEAFVAEETSVDLLGILCCFCDIIFKEKTEIQDHFSKEHSNQEVIYSCNICGKQYDIYNQFANHCYFHRMKSKFGCDECSKRFDRLSLLVLHKEAFHASTDNCKNLFGCTQCEKTYTTANLLKSHLKEIHNITAQKCPHKACIQIFNTSRDLLLHLKTHKTSTNNWCRKCGLEFSSVSLYMGHLDVHRESIYFCPVCCKSYGTKYHVLKHSSVHYQVALHICKYCGKIYDNKPRLLQHVRSHSKLNNYNCTICKKGFTAIKSFEQHLTLHKNYRPFKCALCHILFTSKDTLDNHVKEFHENNPKTVVEEQEQMGADDFCNIESEKNIFRNNISGKTNNNGELNVTSKDFSNFSHTDSVNPTLSQVKIHTDDNTSDPGYVTITKCISVTKEKLNCASLYKHANDIHAISPVIIDKEQEIVKDPSDTNEQIRVGEQTRNIITSTDDTDMQKISNITDSDKDNNNYFQPNYIAKYFEFLMTQENPLKYLKSQNLMLHQIKLKTVENNSNTRYLRKAESTNITEGEDGVSSNLRSSDITNKYNHIDENVQTYSELSNYDDTLHTEKHLKFTVNEIIDDEEILLDNIVPTITDDENLISCNVGQQHTELVDFLPEETTMNFFDDICRDQMVLSSVDGEVVPQEYGPDFVTNAEVHDYTSQFIDIDNQVLPHIDPLLTIKNTNHFHVTSKQYLTNNNEYKFDINHHPEIVTAEDYNFNYNFNSADTYIDNNDVFEYKYLQRN